MCSPPLTQTSTQRNKQDLLVETKKTLKLYHFKEGGMQGLLCYEPDD